MMDPMYRIAGLYSVSIGENQKLMHLYGFNEELNLLLWHKSFGAKADTPCRLDSLYIHEKGPVQMACLHSALPLFLTVTYNEKKGSEFISISYERNKSSSHAGYYIVPDKGIKELCWLGILPLFSTLSPEGVFQIIGPKIDRVEEDVNSYLAILIYSINPQVPYIWKKYFSYKEEAWKISNMIHVSTIYINEKEKYLEYVIFFKDNSEFSLKCIDIKSNFNRNDLDIRCQHKGQFVRNNRDAIISRRMIKYPPTKSDKFRFCLQTSSYIEVYTAGIPKKGETWKCELTGKINLAAEPDIVRINTHQFPLIAAMDKSRLVFIKLFIF